MSKAERLKWAREALELMPVQVYGPLGINRQTFYAREKNLIGAQLLEVDTLVSFYDKAWQERFNPENYPKYKNRQVKKISLPFIIYGIDKNDIETNRIIELLKDNYKSKEKELMEKIINLKAELMRK